MKQWELRNTIKVERAKRDLTQEGLAIAVGVTRKTINGIERGHFVPSTVLALRIVRFFSAHFEEVFYLEEVVVPQSKRRKRSA